MNMLRRLFPGFFRLVIVVSAIVCLFTLFFGVRCYFYRDNISYTQIKGPTGHIRSLTSFGGSLIYLDQRWPRRDESGFDGWEWASAPTRAQTLLVSWSSFGFWRMDNVVMYAGDPTNSPVYSQYGVPFWFLFLLSTPLPTWSLWRWRRNRQPAPGFAVITRPQDGSASSESTDKNIHPATDQT